ncbi:MAG TPA: hypothetical protein VKY74_28145 [Chloroflexia bacterium]|nr:hypothetical protein [Chloroflexia bacterium]
MTTTGPSGPGAGLTVSVWLRFSESLAGAGELVVFAGSDYAAAAQTIETARPRIATYALPAIGPVHIRTIAGSQVTLTPRDARFANVRLALDLATGRWRAPAGGWPWTWQPQPDCSTFAPPAGATLVDCWADALDRALMYVAAGDAGGPATPRQGLLLVDQGSLADQALGLDRLANYPTPGRMGAVRIVAASGPWITLVPVDPAHLDTTFVFDLTTRRWLPLGTTPTWQVTEVPCPPAAPAGGVLIAPISCWQGPADGQELRLQSIRYTQNNQYISTGVTLTATQAAAVVAAIWYAFPLDLGPVWIRAVTDGRLFLVPTAPPFAHLRLVYDFVAGHWLVPAFSGASTAIECGTAWPAAGHCWTLVVQDSVLTLAEGRAAAPGDPAQGVLAISPGLQLDAATIQFYPTPRAVGPVHATGRDGARLTETADQDDRIKFVFDLRTRQWVGP